MLITNCSIVRVDDVDTQQKTGLGRSGPDDFEQVVLRARLLRLQRASEVLRHLGSTLAAKKSSVSRSMGFLAAA